MPRSISQSNPFRTQTRLSVMRAFRRRAERGVNADPDTPPPVESPSANATAQKKVAAYLGWAAVVFFVLAITRRGWVSDDAFITMRAVDHLIGGRGFVYNAGERVLGFTNPLWALVLTVPYFFVRDPYWAPVIGSIAVSGIFGALLVFRGGRDCRVGALLLLALCFSRGFVDFSTSGLENPLTHLLLLLFFFEFFSNERRSVYRLTLFAALLVVNRFDSLLLVLPPMFVVFRRVSSAQDRRAILLGSLPLVLWLLFSVVYYGFPLPNTAYAKLNAEIPRGEMVIQGLSYLLDALVNDPEAVGIVVVAVLVLAARRSSNSRATATLVALGLELAYVVVIGGDFMSVRFLTPAVAVSAVVLARIGQGWLSTPRRSLGAACGVAVAASCVAFSPFRDDPIREKRDFPVTRIVNERAWFQEHLALHVNLRPVQWKAYGLYAEGRAARAKNRRVVLFNNVGMFAWGTGPRIHVVDDMALTDPLLARIPMGYREDWRTGHLPRNIPDGYLDSLEFGRNVIRDPCIAEYFEHLNRIVRGPLFDGERWASIVMLNLPGGMTVRACPERIVPATRQPQLPQPAPAKSDEPEPTQPPTPASS